MGSRLLLDEAISALDAESEERMRQGLESLTEGRTSFVVAHRLATVRTRRRDRGGGRRRVVAHGTHREPLRGWPLYGRLHDLQFTLSADMEERSRAWT